MQTLGPKLETFTAGVTKKYGFDGGFHEAMQSIAAVGGEEKDEKIRCATQPTLPPSPRRRYAAVTRAFPRREHLHSRAQTSTLPPQAGSPNSPAARIL